MQCLGESEGFDLVVADDQTAYGYPSYNDGLLQDCNLETHHPSDGVVRIIQTSVLCYADCNCDRKVDLADLVIMKGEFLRTDCNEQNPCQADCNGDNKVDLSDLVIMKDQFLRTDCPACP